MPTKHIISVTIFVLASAFGLFMGNDVLAAPQAFILPVPFGAQAPFGQWKDEIYQDGCEEASAIIVMAYVNNSSLTPSSTTALIKKITDFEKSSTEGYRPDLSTEDTLKLIRNYFKFAGGKIFSDATAADIIAALGNGEIVIAPMNGQLLSNPYFTPPGPIHHMLVVIGYDPIRNRFITNDPGTRHGAGLSYLVPEFMNAMSDYPTGNHLVSEQIRRNIIVIQKP